MGGELASSFQKLDSARQLLGSEVLVSDPGQTVSSPALVWTGIEVGVAWTQDSFTTPSVRFARLNRPGFPGGLVT